MDTMTGVKIVGGLCGTFLIFLLGGWAAEEIYHVGSEYHGEGEEAHAQAYTIPVADSGDAAAEEDAVPFEEVYAVADASAGEGVWRQCASCHVLDAPENKTGPHLVGVVGREQGNVDGYGYSSSFAELAGAWTVEELNGFLEDPDGWVPGTKMTYRGLAKVEDRANLIAYLEQAGG